MYVLVFNKLIKGTKLAKTRKIKSAMVNQKYLLNTVRNTEFFIFVYFHLVVFLWTDNNEVEYHKLINEDKTVSLVNVNFNKKKVKYSFSIDIKCKHVWI